MNSVLNHLIPCFLEIMRFPITWGLVGIGIVGAILVPGLTEQQTWLLVISVVLLAFFISWVIKCYVDFNTRKRLIVFELHSLCPEEKEILRSMLKSSVNCYELKISHNFDMSAQTKQSVLICRLTCLRDRGLLDLTQTPYDANNDLLKATMPVLVWGILNKKYKKAPAYFVRVSNNIKQPSIKKRFKKVLHKRKKR